MTTAADLNPGDTYRAADGIPHTVVNVSTAGIRTYVTHADGEERVLFPTARVTVLPERTPDDIEECIPIIFLDGEEGDEWADVLFNAEGVVVHGITLESAQATLNHLIQWHTPGSDVESSPGIGAIDRWVILEDRWLIAGSPGLGYVSLAEVTKWRD